MIIVNPTTRQFSIPGTDQVFGVTDDASSEIRHFQCPRYVGNNVDVAGSFVRINYRNGNGEIDSYLVQEITVDGSNVLFDWVLSQNATMYKGNLNFVMCVVGPDTKVKWHTTIGRGQVLEGLEPDSHMIEEATVDVIAQLVALVKSQTEAVADTGVEWVRNIQLEGTDQIVAVQTAGAESKAAAVAEIEAKGASTLATIPEDYTTVQNTVRTAANAIRGNVSGEAIRVDDVSPMEHYPKIWVHGKNLIPYPYKQSASSDYGGSFVAQADGGVLASGTPTGYASLSLYEGVPLVKSGKVILSCSGDSANISLEMAMYDAKRNMVFYRETSESLPPVSVDLDLYPLVTSWVIYLKRNASNVEMRGIAYPQLEVGEVATEYAPYINPTTITVSRCGKNILPYPFYNKTKTENGITFTDNGDGTLTVNGTATDNAFFHFLVDGSLRVKGKYVLSGLSGGSGVTYYAQPFIDGVAVRGLTNDSMSYDFDGILDKITMVVSKGVTVQNLIVTLQLEKGDAATQFEKYHGLEFVASADGSVASLGAVSPTMTLLTDTAGVTIDCEYSRDTNKVIEDILNKLAALVGNT